MENNKHLELNIDRNFGDLISIFFDFLKQNIKNYTKIFLRYNAPFLILYLIAGYITVSGYMDMFSAIQNQRAPGDFLSSTISNSLISIVSMLLVSIISLLNYGLASSYLIFYDKNKGIESNAKEIWDYTVKNLGKMVLFVLATIVIAIIVLIPMVIVMVIPLLNIILIIPMISLVTSWIGISFYCMLKEDIGPFSAYGKAISLIGGSLWKTIGVSMVVTFIVYLLLMLVMAIPGAIVGVMVFNSVESGDPTSLLNLSSTIIFTLFYFLYLFAAMYVGGLLQFQNGIMYHAFHEKEYNEHAQSKIDQIGELGEEA